MATNEMDDTLRNAGVPITYANNNRGYATPLEVGTHSVPNGYRRSNVPARSKLRDATHPEDLATRTAQESYNRNRATFRVGGFETDPGEHEAVPRPRPYSSARPLTQGTAPTTFRGFLPALDTKPRRFTGRRFSAAVWALRNGAKYGMQPPRGSRSAQRNTDPITATFVAPVGVRIVGGPPPGNVRRRRLGDRI